MQALIRFFWPGPGKWLLLILAGLGLAYYAGKYQQAHRDDGSVHSNRPVGQPSFDPKVDPAYAQKETGLVDRPVTVPSRPPQRQERPETVRLIPKPALFVYEAPAPSPSPSPAQQGAAQLRRASAPDPEPLVWLPAGVAIPCRLSGNLESGDLDAPITGVVDTDVKQRCGNQLVTVIPANTILTGWAEPQAVRDRISASGTWQMTFADGRSIRFPGVIQTRQEDGGQTGPENGTPGLLGEVTVTDPAAQGKALIGLLVTSLIATGQTAAGAALQAAHSSGFYQVPDTAPIVAKYIDQLLNGRTGGDATYVYVKSSAQFSVVSSVTLVPATRTPYGAMQGNAGQAQQDQSTSPSETPALEPAVQAALQQAQATTNSANQNAHETKRGSSRIHF